MAFIVALLALMSSLEALPPAAERDTRITSASRPVIATVGTRDIGEDTFRETLGNKLLALETQLYRAKRQILDGMVETRLLELAAQDAGEPVDRFTAREVAKDLVPVSDEEVRAVYEASRSRLAGTPETEAIASIRTSMEHSRLAQARQRLVAKLRGRYPVQLFMLPPRIDLSKSDAPAKGPIDAPVRVVVFADFECPFCSRHSSTLKELEDRFGDRLRVEYRHFPLPIHKEALAAAEAAACMESQGRFWEMHDVLYANQKRLGREDLFLHAAAAKGDIPAFRACLEGRKTLQRVEADRKAGENYGVAATPATFINWRLTPGAAPLSELVMIVEEELVSRQNRALPLKK